MTLVEFLLARIGEDEAYWATAQRIANSWKPQESADVISNVMVAVNELLAADPAAAALMSLYGQQGRPAPNDWARGITECAVKRRIIGMYGPIRMSEPSKGFPYGGVLGSSGEETYYDVLRLLAMSYVDHPDFEEAWRL